jgi:hypothetical protein
MRAGLYFAVRPEILRYLSPSRVSSGWFFNFYLGLLLDGRVTVYARFRLANTRP